MKKIMLFAAACVALAACTKNINTPAPEKATAFEKGQKVTLTVTNPQTKATSTLNTTSGAVDFKWETGDQILVKVGKESATFTVSKLNDGGASAEFEGTMPGEGTTFDVQFPTTTPDLSSQTYTAGEAIPHDMMLATATGCTINTPFSLTAQNAALRLNLYGLNREVSSIVVTNTTADPNVSYTLNCSAAVRVSNSSATATPFLLVIPAGASAWNFKVEVTVGNVTANPDLVPTYTEGSYTGDGIVITTGTTFSTSSAQTFSAGQVLDMPVKAITTVWAPVNCGYVAKTGNSGEALGYPYGKLYQWGRKYGQGYGRNPYFDATYPSGEQIKATYTGINGTEDPACFYVSADSGSQDEIPYVSDWITTNSSNTFWNLNEGTSNPVSKNTNFDPCPTGWRVPTVDECGNLVYSDWNSSTQKGTIMRSYTWDDTNKTGTISGLTLPAAGVHTGSTGASSYRGEEGSYFSSTVNSNSELRCFVYRIYLTSTKIKLFTSGPRATGSSVRCVQE